MYEKRTTNALMQVLNHHLRASAARRGAHRRLNATARARACARSVRHRAALAARQSERPPRAPGQRGCSTAHWLRLQNVVTYSPSSIGTDVLRAAAARGAPAQRDGRCAGLRLFCAGLRLSAGAVGAACGVPLHLRRVPPGRVEADIARLAPAVVNLEEEPEH
eukprot:7384078-Prymnesium_polylepis.1